MPFFVFRLKCKTHAPATRLIDWDRMLLSQRKGWVSLCTLANAFHAEATHYESEANWKQVMMPHSNSRHRRRT